MDNQTKFVLTVDANGAVVKVQRLGEDGSLSDVPVHEFLSQLTVSYGAFAGSGTLTVQSSPATSQDPGQTPQGPVIHQAPPPSPPPPPSEPASTPKRPPSVPDVKKTEED